MVPLYLNISGIRSQCRKMSTEERHPQCIARKVYERILCTCMASLECPRLLEVALVMFWICRHAETPLKHLVPIVVADTSDEMIACNL